MAKKQIGFTVTTTKKEVKIHDKKLPRHVGISLWTDNALQEIRKNSGPLVTANEFQVHYWSLNYRKIAKDGSILDISIPTVFFNYAQTVSGAAIDFELKDVEEMSDMLAPVQQAEISKVQKAIGEQFSDFTPISVALNTIHKHPGGRTQGFSGTDYKKDHETDTGVVFPLASGDMRANFASIMCISQGKTYLAHTEFRIAHGSVPDKDGITYFHGRSATIVKGATTTTEVSETELMFGIEPVTTDHSYIEYDGLEDSSFLEAIEARWKAIDYEPSTEFIKPENVTAKVYAKSYPKANPNLYPGQTHHVTTPMITPAQKELPSVNTRKFLSWNERKLVVALLWEEDGIAIKSVVELNAMSDMDLFVHQAELEEHYYVNPTATDPLSISEITDLQDDVILDKYHSAKVKVLG